MRQITAQHVAQVLFELQLVFILCLQFTFDSPFWDSLTTANQNQYVIMQAKQLLVIINIDCNFREVYMLCGFAVQSCTGCKEKNEASGVK